MGLQEKEQGYKHLPRAACLGFFEVLKGLLAKEGSMQLRCDPQDSLYLLYKLTGLLKPAVKVKHSIVKDMRIQGKR